MSKKTKDINFIRILKSSIIIIIGLIALPILKAQNYEIDSLSPDVGKEKLIVTNLLNQAVAYITLKDYTAAKKSLQEGYPYITSSSAKFNYLMLEVKLKLLQKDCSGAFVTIKKATKWFSFESPFRQKEAYFKNLAKISSCLGNYEAASLNMDKASSYLEIPKQESLQIEKKYQAQLEQDAMEMLNLQTRHFEGLNRRKNFMMNVMKGAILLLSLLTFFYYRHYLIQKRLNKTLKQLNEQQTNIINELQKPFAVIEELVTSNQQDTLTPEKNQLPKLANPTLDSTEMDKKSLIPLPSKQQDADPILIKNSANNFGVDISDFTKKNQDWLLEVNELILQRIHDFDLEIKNIAALKQLSVKQFSRKIKQLTNFTAKQYIQEIRYSEAHRMLASKEYDSVKMVSYTVGLKDISNFSRNFKARFGKYPSVYLNQ